MVWLLGVSSEHDYKLFEGRARQGVLLPSEEDDLLLVLERQSREFGERVGPGVARLVADAWEAPGETQRGTVGGDLVRLDVAVEALVADGEVSDGDLYLVVQLPFGPAAQRLTTWPGSAVLTELVDCLEIGEFVPDYAVEALPDGSGGWRAVDRSRELPVRLIGIEPPELWA